MSQLAGERNMPAGSDGDGEEEGSSETGQKGGKEEEEKKNRRRVEMR